MNIIDVREEHIAPIEELEKQCFSVPWTAEQLRTQLKEGHIFLAAEREGEILGYVGLAHVLDEGYISNIAVAESARRQGIAAALLTELERRCREKELSFMTLEVRAGNAPAIALYEKRGFERVGLRKKYYKNPTEDAILMTLEFEKI